MTAGGRGELALALVLAAVAGFVDAVGFLELGNLFVSFMSGNSTQLGLALAQTDWKTATLPAVIIATFLLGVVIGRLLVVVAGGWCRAVVLIVEALLLVLSLLPTVALHVAVLLMTFAMGLQNTAMHQAAGRKVSLTFMTGMLVRVGEKLSEAILGGSFKDVVLESLMWFGFILGAVIGALGFATYGRLALAAPVGCLALAGLICCLPSRVAAD
ncbi:YoaK family protein [Rhodopseudomonas sp. B29]|uniref:YoaK family protein n=1 Tax=Rhodopseudomonas sp. B29 TaxID=95607 RepID=UPI00034D6C06|nr:YoaK family protein [Rhodopseudomonas sp. B29]